MIIYRAFYREASTITVAVVLVLLVLFMLQGTGGVLARVNAWSEHRSMLMSLIVLYPLLNFSVVLMLGLYVGLLVTLSRWYRDNEMAVLAACGVSISTLLRPLFIFAAFFCAVLLVEGLVVRPQVRTATEHIEKLAAQAQGSSLIRNGAFNSSSSGQDVLYVEKSLKDGIFSGAFVRSFDKNTGRERILRAREIRHERAADGEFILLSDGRMSEGNPGALEYRTASFDQYRIHIDIPTEVARQRHIESIPTLKLFGAHNLAERAELHIRLSKPATVFALVMFALALSYSNPRRARHYNLFIAIFLFFIYMQFLLIAESLVRSGKLPPVMSLWWVHVIFGLLGAYFLRRRYRGLPLFALPQGARHA